MATRPVMMISGTSRGIGRGLAEHFVEAGYQVAGCSRGKSDLAVQGYDHSELDVTDERQIRAWVRAVRRRLGRIDVLVSNAGMVPPPTLLNLTPAATLRSALQVNVEGTFLLCREVAKVMMGQRSGRIITMSSMAVGLHDVGTAAYSASKAAVVEMTKVLARELAPVGITCNVVAPSVFPTDSLEQMGAEASERALASLTLPRNLEIEEIAGVVAFFAAPTSTAITGQVIHLGLVT